MEFAVGVVVGFILGGWVDKIWQAYEKQEMKKFKDGLDKVETSARRYERHLIEKEQKAKKCL